MAFVAPCSVHTHTTSTLFLIALTIYYLIFVTTGRAHRRTNDGPSPPPLLLLGNARCDFGEAGVLFSERGAGRAVAASAAAIVRQNGKMW